MYSSAMVSSCLVVMPGATWSVISSRVSPTSSPAARILTSCSGVLPSMRSRPKSPTISSVGQHRDEALGHLVDVPHAVNLHEQPALTVDLGQRGGLLAVDRLALTDDVLGVVHPRLGLGPVQQPPHHGVLVDGQLQDVVDRTLLAQHVIEGGDLSEGAG